MSRAENRQLVAGTRARGGYLPAALARKVLKDDDAVARLLAGGLWQEALPGVLVPAAVEVTRDIREDAVTWWDTDALLSHFSAARHEGIWVPEHPDAWVSVPIDSDRRSLKGLHVTRSRAFEFTPRTDGRHRWTPPDRILVDLASHLTRKQLDAVMLNAIRGRKTTAKDVMKAAQLVRTRSGVRQLLDLAELWTPERETVLEGRLFDDITAVVSYQVQRQLVVESPDRRHKARLDAAIPELMLDFEADGLFYHSTDQQIAADQFRDRWMAGGGWLTVRFREGVLDDRLAVRRDIAAIVARRGQDRRAA